MAFQNKKRVVSSLFLVIIVAAISIAFVLGQNSCNGEKVGFVGASNTVGSGKYPTLIAKGCSNLLVKGEEAKSLQYILNNKASGIFFSDQEISGLDILVISPSGNGLYNYDTFVEGLKKMVEYSKQINPNLKIAVLTVSPRKNYNLCGGEDCSYKWGPNLQFNLDNFNLFLLQGALSFSSMINQPIDIYSVLESSNEKGVCGYCTQDKLHWTSQGQALVANKIMQDLYGISYSSDLVTPGTTQAFGVSTSTTTPVATLVTDQGLYTKDCESADRCNEIDEVWRLRLSTILGSGSNQVWVSGVGWKTYIEPTTASSSAALPSTSSGATLTSATGVDGLAVSKSDAPNPYIRAFLRMITLKEGGAGTCNGISPYQTLVGGQVISDKNYRYGGTKASKGKSNCEGSNFFNGYDGHPGIFVKFASGNCPGSCSTAAGRYQYLGSSWEDQGSKTKNGVSDFSPANQDLAYYLFLEKNGIGNLLQQLGNNDPNNQAFKNVWRQIMAPSKSQLNSLKKSKKELSNKRAANLMTLEKGLFAGIPGGKNIGGKWASLPYACYPPNQGCFDINSDRFKETSELYVRLLQEELGLKLISGSPSIPVQPVDPPPTSTSSAPQSSTATVPIITSLFIPKGAHTFCDQTTPEFLNIDQQSNRLTQTRLFWETSLSNLGLLGKTWVGKLESNGPNDNYKYENGEIGRITLVYIPCTTNLNLPIEIIYYFHGHAGFAHWDMEERVLKQSKEMATAGRNFVIIFPELPWSSSKLNIPPGSSDSQHDFIRTDIPHKNIWLESDSNLAVLHQDIISIIKQVNPNTQIGYISLTGHSAGGAAIGFASIYPSKENNFLNQIMPNKITFSDGIYNWNGLGSAVQETYNNYVKSNSAISLNLLVQDPSRQLAHDPTKYAIEFVKSLGIGWTAQDGNWDTSSVESYSTPGAKSNQVYIVPDHINVVYLPLQLSHKQIGEISLAWLPEK